MSPVPPGTSCLLSLTLGPLLTGSRTEPKEPFSISTQSLLPLVTQAMDTILDRH